MDPLTRLIEYFKRFPGVGPRQARRFAYFMLRESKDSLNRFSKDLSSLKDSIKQCESCFIYFSNDVDASLCKDCRSEERNAEELLVVEKDIDVETIKKSGVYHGLFFILGGTIPILEKKPFEKVRLKELEHRVLEKKNGKTVKEVILALSVNPEGEHTVRVIRELFDAKEKTKELKVTVFGRGLSTGTELEYSDSDTITSAFKNRF